MIDMVIKTLKNKKKVLPLTLAGLMLFTFSAASVTYGNEDQHNRKHYAGSNNPDKNWSNNKNYDEGKVKQYVQLRGLLQEHAAMAGVVTINRYDNRPEFEASRVAAIKNGEMIAHLVGQKYGGEARSAFLDQWNRHLQLYIQYTDSLKNNDTALRDQTVAELTDFTEKTSGLLARTGDFSQHDIRNELRIHVSLAAAVIDAHAAGDYNAQYTKMHEAHEHAGMMADKLAQYQH